MILVKTCYRLLASTIVSLKLIHYWHVAVKPWVAMLLDDMSPVMIPLAEMPALLKTLLRIRAAVD